MVPIIEFLTRLDTSLFLVINHGMAHPLLDHFFIFITESRHILLPLLIAIILHWRFKGGRRTLLIVGLAALTVMISDPLCVRVIKPLVGRWRPNNPEHLVAGGRFLLGYSRSLSFPSAHAMNMFAQAAVLTRSYPRQAGYFFILAALVGLSRVYVGVHYPFDVLGGAIIGTALGFLIWLGYRRIAKYLRTCLSCIYNTFCR